MAKQKKKRIKNNSIAAVGEEPTWDSYDKNDFNILFMKALNWYNYVYSNTDAKKFLIKYFTKKENKDAIRVLKKTNECYISTTAGWISKMHFNNAPLQEKHYSYLDEHIEYLRTKIEEPIENIKNKKSVHQLTIDKANEYISFLEGIVDDYFSGEMKSKPNLYTLMLGMNVSGKHASYITEHFKNTRDEIKEAISDIKTKKDTDLSQAYSYNSNKELKTLLEFYDDIISNANMIIENVSNKRKPRKKRKAKTSSLIKKLNYLKDYPDMKLVSLNPEKLIGSKYAFFYNTKNGELAFYESSSIEGFSVKGSTIQNFDGDISFIKRIGKKQNIIDEIKSETRIRTIKFLKKMKRAEKPVTGRINKHTIILKVYS